MPLIAGVQRAMRIAISRESEALDTNLPFLATVGSTSPLYRPLWYSVGYYDLLPWSGHG